MRLLFRWLVAAAALLATVACVPAFGEQIVFTSRLQLGCPVVLSSARDSKTFGFESAELWNDGALPVRAVRLRVTFREGIGDEVTDDRLVIVNLEPQDRKRVVIELGHMEGLRHRAKSRGQQSGLAILTIGVVEFQDGTVWEDNGPADGTPFEPAPPPFKSPK